MGASLRETGSREPSPDGLGPSGFDPARIGDLPEKLFVAWIEEEGDVSERVGDLLYKAAKTLADTRKTFERILEIESGAGYCPLQALSEIERIAKAAPAIEAQRAATVKQGAVADESAVAKPDAQGPSA